MPGQEGGALDAGTSQASGGDSGLEGTIREILNDLFRTNAFDPGGGTRRPRDAPITFSTDPNRGGISVFRLGQLREATANFQELIKGIDPIKQVKKSQLEAKKSALETKAHEVQQIKRGAEIQRAAARQEQSQLGRLLGKRRNVAIMAGGLALLWWFL